MENTYYRFSKYLKDTFGERVQKISVDAGLSCPNRDGKIGHGGCIYCDVSSFNFERNLNLVSISEQIKKRINLAKHRKINKYMVYFQAFSNTYAPVDVLSEIYANVRNFNDIVAISIGTRPDCIDEEKLKLINSYTDDYEVWIEYGLQSINDGTLRAINRGHTFKDFELALSLTRKYPKIKICVHTILGLPGEETKDMLLTADYLANSKIDGIKIHPIHIVKGTVLEKEYLNGEFEPLGFDDYVALVVEFIHRLPKNMVILRLGADCPAEKLIAPQWIHKKNELLSAIEKKLKLLL